VPYSGCCGLWRAHDHAVEHALHLDLDFIQQFGQLAGLDEASDVVVGIETLASRSKALTDSQRRAFLRR
jgi:hypothetical protein